ncbi:serine/threonine protein kinase [Streptomyces venezuelae]|uniref:non-specific serine/threonine protein kinase n=1 Tax=Streptomyces venezuelae TaxID=54571 RepID=A0A5P2D739_STRVZ|nr:serine/threonine-protein kinase [Streptomyces venezuelae]QES50573.1 serine/threonine protein kinase [Streptomyces venezuelae]
MSAPGDVIDGRFELVERLGSGGMGTVWRALDRALHRDVAIKEVRPPTGGEDPETLRVLRERVLREARAQARISHPHVVTIHHIVDGDPHPWLVMELLPGNSLQQRLEQGPLRPAEAVRIGREVLSGLRAAHDAGIRHRDVKPANVLLRADGSAVLTDFGIAALQGAASLTLTGEVIGTPEYLAPERIRGADLPASDLWSLGMMLYVCVEGVSPMRRATTLATLAAVLDDPVPAPRRAGVLGSVLAAVLVRDPTQRPDAARLDALLAAVAAGGAVPPEPTRVDRPPVAAPAPPPEPRSPGSRFGPAPVLPERPAPRPPLAAPTPPPYEATPRDALPTLGSGGPVDPAPQTGRRQRLTPPAAAAAVIALALLGVGGYVLFKPEAPGRDDGRNPTVPPVIATTASPPKPTPTPTPTPPLTPTLTPTLTLPTALPTPGPTPPPATPATRPEPEPTGRWIAQLHSEPESTGTAARDRRLAAVRTTVPEALVLRSRDHAALNPGYWVIYAPGPFADGRAALAFCAERGRTTATLCIGRWLSDDRADHGYQCAPPASAPAGRCRRPAT